MAKLAVVETTLDRIVGGGQAMGIHPDGRKLFVWGGLPGETVRVQETKRRSKLVEGRVIEVLKASDVRIAPKDHGSYLSTSPWQIMTPEAEVHYKAALLEEAFELHDIVLPNPIVMDEAGQRFSYRNKMEFSFYWDVENAQLELAFFIRGSKGKIPVQGSSLARPEINRLALEVRNLLRTKPIEARSLKTLLIRCDQAGRCVWQLYIRDEMPDLITSEEAVALPGKGGELIFSDPRSPASRITKRLARFSDVSLQDTIMNTPFSYAAESFFQVNLPMYQRVLGDMKDWLTGRPLLDLYSGVGTIGLTIGPADTTLIELDANAVKEMKLNIKNQALSAKAIHAASEHALDYLTSDHDVIVDPPRAGLHTDVISRLLETRPARILYLSCNPVTQARDVSLLADTYGVRHHNGYNFFPATPHIEHLVVLDRK